jgi:hypothetical protein
VAFCHRLLGYRRHALSASDHLGKPREITLEDLGSESKPCSDPAAASGPTRRLAACRYRRCALRPRRPLTPSAASSDRDEPLLAATQLMNLTRKHPCPSPLSPKTWFIRSNRKSYSGLLRQSRFINDTHDKMSLFANIFDLSCEVFLKACAETEQCGQGDFLEPRRSSAQDMRTCR